MLAKGISALANDGSQACVDQHMYVSVQVSGATGNDCKHRPGYIPEQTGGSQAMMECISLS